MVILNLTHNLVLREKMLGLQLDLGKDLMDYFSVYLKKEFVKQYSEDVDPL